MPRLSTLAVHLSQILPHSSLASTTPKKDTPGFHQEKYVLGSIGVGYHLINTLISFLTILFVNGLRRPHDNLRSRATCGALSCSLTKSIKSRVCVKRPHVHGYGRYQNANADCTILLTQNIHTTHVGSIHSLIGWGVFFAAKKHSSVFKTPRRTTCLYNPYCTTRTKLSLASRSRAKTPGDSCHRFSGIREKCTQ